MTQQISVTPIRADQLGEVGRFLHENLNRRFSAGDWVASLQHPWCESRPNFGVQLRDSGKLVGVLLAIHSDQVIDGRTEKFCNPHSWCVLDEYRNHGINLVLAAIKRRDYHFTMLTPNLKVAEIFRHLRFRMLDDEVIVFPNLPSPRAAFSSGVTESDIRLIPGHLSGPTRRDFELHSEIPWLKFLAFGQGNDICLVVYKTGSWKRMSCARLIHVSNPETFDRHRWLMQHHLLTRKGLAVSHVEKRFLSRSPRLAYRGKRTQPKLFWSPTLTGSQIQDLYSELVALDV